jgi:drug/metabolite transporter (DMT)-like permease
MGILLGLVTAVTWGGSDFLARFATQRVGTLRAMLYMQLLGFVLLTMFLPGLGGLGHLADGSGWQPWGWGVLAGGINAVCTLCLYRSFEVGKLAVVSPLSASYPALTVILSVLSGEKLGVARAAGIAAIMVGVLLVAGGERPAKIDAPDGESAAGERQTRTLSKTERVQHPVEEDGHGCPVTLDSDKAGRRGGKGVGYALCSALGFGFLFWLLGVRIIPRVGAVQGVWMIRMTCSVVVALILLFARLPMGLPRGSRWMALGMGAGDTSAFVVSNRGMQIEQVAVISVLGSLYGAVTVGLAAIVLREHVSRWQWLGIFAIFVGIFLISRH